MFRLIAAGADRGDVFEVHGTAVEDAHDQVRHFLAAGQEHAGLHRDFQAPRYQRSRLAGTVARDQRHAQVIQRQAKASHPFWIEHHVHDVRGAADGVNVTGSGHALQFSFQGMCHFQQFEAAARGIFRPQRGGNDGHIVNALGLHQRWQHAEIGRNPVLVGIDGVVQAHQRNGAVLTDLELDGHHGHAGT